MLQNSSEDGKQNHRAQSKVAAKSAQLNILTTIIAATGLFVALIPVTVSAYSFENFKKVAPNIAERTEDDYGDMINIAALLHDYDEDMILAVMVVESEGNQTALSHKGAQGLMQLMPATARMLGVKDPNEPFQNILGGTKYLKELENRYHFSREETLVAYNMGPERAKRWLTQYRPNDSLYVKKVMYVYRVLQDRDRSIASVSAPILATGIMTKPRNLSLLTPPSSLSNIRKDEIEERD